MKVQEWKEKLEQAQGEELEALLTLCRQDERAGVRKLAEGYEKKKQALEKEYERLSNMLIYERKYNEDGVICGIDEAGRGPLAGPVVAAAVIMPVGFVIPGVNDSKKVPEKKREELYDKIMESAVSVGVGIISPARIDEINILQATYEAMRSAVSQLSPRPAITLNDAVTIPDLGADIHQVPIIKGDAKSHSIAAASIIAKVTRDRMMRDYDELYPEYGFAGHKGYGSASHIEALKIYGMTPIHRRSFLKNILGEELE